MLLPPHGVPALVGTVTIEANTLGIYEAGGFLYPGSDVFVGSSGSDVVTVNTATFTVGEVPATTEAQKLSASDADVEDSFGTSIAADGYIAVVGAYLDDDNGEDSGSAYVYQRLGTSWVQGPKLLASDGVADDQFGQDVAISTPVIAIGAQASAYLFRRNGNSWTQETKLTGPVGDGFGEAIAIAGDRVVVGARYDDAGGNTHSGAAYVFRFNGVDWIEEAKLTASDAMTNNYFGTDVAIHGTTILVGANGRNSGTGAAYVFEFNGSSWVETSILTSTPTIADSWFGHAVALNHDIAAISAPLYDDAQPGAQDSGSVFMFRHNGSNWIEEAKLKRNNPLDYDFFGRGVSLSGDAILIHELQTNADDPTGGAHLFYYDGNDWLFQERYHGSGTTAEYFLIFGSSAVIAGSDALVGAPTHDGNASESGAVYVFDLPMGLVQVPSFGALGVGALCGLVALAGWRRLRAQAKTVHLHPN